MTTTDTPRTDYCLNTHSMINHQKWCHKCGGFVEVIYAGNPRSCRCDPKADRIKELEAEVEMLNHQLLKNESDLLQSQDINSFLDTEFRIACKRAEKAEAEVEELNRLMIGWKQRATMTETSLEAEKAEVAELKKGKVFVDPKWIYDLETQLAKAHEELCQAGLREYGN